MTDSGRTVLLGILGIIGLSFYSYFFGSPRLAYTIYPTVELVVDSTEMSLLTVKIENVGKADAKNARVQLKMPDSVSATDIGCFRGAIPPTRIRTEKRTEWTYEFKSLNESAGCYFRVITIVDGSIQFGLASLSADGLAGPGDEIRFQKTQPTWFNKNNTLITLALYLAMLLLGFGLYSQSRRRTV